MNATPSNQNQRLRRALFEARITPQKLAEQIEVDPKTVERWITKGRTPYARHQHSVSIALGVPETELWPQTTQSNPHLEPREVGVSSIRIVSPRWDVTDRERSEAQPIPTSHAERTRIIDDRVRALMSWVDTTAPSKERDIHPRPAPVPQQYNSYSRSGGVERSR